MAEKFGELQPLSESERTSGVSKIIGDNPEKFSDAFRKIFELGGEVEIGEIEREKSAEETEIIEGILEKMPDFIKRYGGNPVPLLVGHVHFLEKEKASPEILKILKHQGEEGFYNYKHQLIGVYDAKNLLANALVVVHEALHFNSFQSIELEGKEKAHDRRGGFAVYSRKNK